MTVSLFRYENVEMGLSSVDFLKLLPKNHLSHWVGKMAQISWPEPVNSKILRSFAKYYKINLQEAEKSIEEYKSLEDLFTRKLKNGVRPISEDPVIHPCDSLITQSGTINEGELIQAKGKKYSLKDFIPNKEISSLYKNGHFATYYLCPTDYHRVHMPVIGEVTDALLVPGQLWPVNFKSVESVKDLFCRNERVVVNIKTKQGPVAAVFVGATNVGKITVSFDGSLQSNYLPERKIVTHRHYEFPVIIKKGNELGIFHFGSTVVMLFSKEFVTQNPGLSFPINSKVKIGQSAF